MKNIDKEKKKRPVWKRFLAIGIVIISIFNVLIITGMVYSVTLLINAEKTNAKIGKELAPLCLYKDYVYDDAEGSRIKMDYYHEISNNGSSNLNEIIDFDYYYVHFLLRSEEYYFFLFVFDTSSLHHWNQEYRIYKLNNSLEEFEEVISLGQGISDWRSGFDNKMYYMSNSSYYCFDFKTYCIQEDDSNKESETILKISNEEYLSTFGIERGTCERNNKICSYEYQGFRHKFDENTINNDILKYIYKFDFKPRYHYSYLSGKTAFLYYSSTRSCLLIDYNRDEKIIVGYQLFQNCDLMHFDIFNKIV